MEGVLRVKLYSKKSILAHIQMKMLPYLYEPERESNTQSL